MKNAFKFLVPALIYAFCVNISVAAELKLPGVYIVEKPAMQEQPLSPIEPLAPSDPLEEKQPLPPPTTPVKKGEVNEPAVPAYSPPPLDNNTDLSTPSRHEEKSYSISKKLVSGDEILLNKMISREGAKLKMDADGSLKLIGDKVMWSSGPVQAAVKARFENGNLALYSKDDDRLWQTGTSGYPDAELQIQGRGDLVGVRIITKKGDVLWEKGHGFTRVYRLAWRDLYMATFNSAEWYIFGSIVVNPIGLSKVSGHSNTFWKRSSAAGSRVYLKPEESYNADNHYGFEGRYKGEFDNKFQDYELVESFNGDYGVSEKGAQIQIMLWDWNRIKKNRLIGIKLQTIYFKDFEKYDKTPLKIELDSAGTLSVLYFHLFRIR